MNKHTSTHPVTGETATRNSKNRTYSHAVWVRETLARRIEIAQATLESNRAYVAKCERIVSDWDAHVAQVRADAVARYRGSRWLTDEQKAEYIEEAVERSTVKVSPLSTWTDEYLPDARESVVKAEASLAAIEAEGDVAEWGVVTWCGRHDLAVKQAASWAKKGYETLIVEAVLNAPKAAKVVEPEPVKEPAAEAQPEPAKGDRYTVEYPDIVVTDGEHEGEPFTVTVVLGGTDENGDVIETLAQADAFATRAAEHAVATHAAEIRPSDDEPADLYDSYAERFFDGDDLVLPAVDCVGQDESTGDLFVSVPQEDGTYLVATISPALVAALVARLAER